MDTPQPPRDSSLRNIIDKLAEFVARNGPEFELITKQKQQGNPKFEFLYGGEFCNYYQYRVVSEEAFLAQQAAISQTSHSSHQQQQFHVQGQQSQQHDNTGKLIFQNQGNNEANSTHLWGVNSPSNPNNQTSASNGNATAAVNITAQIEAINLQQNTLRDQIHQSEQNLSAQHSALMSQQKKNIDEAITKAQNSALEKQAEENNISLMEFDDILQPIIDACTKDSISAGKNWILQHSTDTAKNNVVLQYLLKKALLNGSTFTQKLHLIYLVNDILHHCIRKNANDLKNSLENVVIPMFCSAELIASEDQRAKLAKLLSLWESKAKFFDACVISKLQSPDSSMQEYKTNLMNMHHDIVSNFTQATKTTLDSYQKQHQIFIQHATQQIQVLDQQMQNLEQQILAAVLPSAALIPTLMDAQQLTASNPFDTSNNNQKILNMQNKNQMTPQPLMAQKIAKPNADDDNDRHLNYGLLGIPPEENDQPLYGNLYINSSQSNLQQNNSYNSSSADGCNNGIQQQLGNCSEYLGKYHDTVSDLFQSFGQKKEGEEYQNQTDSFLIPDLSKPPPGFLGGGSGSQQIMGTSNQNLDSANILGVNIEALGNSTSLDSETDSTPAVPEEEPKPPPPYYNLPAGLMVSLIRLEDYNYRSLNPEKIKLPPPTPQSERLTLALAAFYAPPSHNRPRDNEGWEKLGLYEYYKVKNAAKKQKEDEVNNGSREKTRSPSPIAVDLPKPKKLNKRCYRSKSPSRSPRCTKSKSPYRSRSRSPQTLRQSEKTRSSRYSTNQKNRSPAHRSPIRDRGDRIGTNNDRNDRTERIDRNERNDRDRERERDRENTRERNSIRRERERSVTPPSFLGSNYGKSNNFLEESTKSHQMLMRMAWPGSTASLGSKNLCLDQPISGGDIRDRKDGLKAVGINLHDPFEDFRKNKGVAFENRMRTKGDEKS